MLGSKTTESDFSTKLDTFSAIAIAEAVPKVIPEAIIIVLFLFLFSCVRLLADCL